MIEVQRGAVQWEVLWVWCHWLNAPLSLSFLVYQKAKTRIPNRLSTICLQIPWRSRATLFQHAAFPTPGRRRRTRTDHDLFTCASTRSTTSFESSAPDRNWRAQPHFWMKILPNPSKHRRNVCYQNWKLCKPRTSSPFTSGGQFCIFKSNHSPTRKWRNCYRRLVHLTAWIPQPKRHPSLPQTAWRHQTQFPPGRILWKPCLPLMRY